MNRRLALKLLASAPAWAQRRDRRPSSAAASPWTVMDAVVTDDRGNPVSDLTAADFAIYEGTEARSIAAFTAVDTVSGACRAAEPLPLAATMDPDELHRTFLLVVDDAGISAARAAALRGALDKFVNEQMGARDRAALIRTADGIGRLEHLTVDRRLLGEAIERVASNPAAITPSAPPWPETLRYTLEGLRDVRGRKAVVLFWDRAPENYDFGRLIAMANRTWSSIYPIHTGGAPAATAGGMASLAKETRGLDLEQEIPAALTRILEDQASYYLLGFHAESSSDPVSVKALRPGLELRSRAGLPGIAPPRAQPDDGAPATELPRVIASPFNSGSLRVGLSVLFSHGATDHLNVLLLVGGRELGVTHKLNGAYEAGLDFLLTVYGMNGQAVYDRGASNFLRMTDDDYRRALTEGLNYAIDVPVGKPGVFEVCAAVLDGTSSNTGIAHCLGEVPDVSKGELLLSGILLEAASSTAAEAAGASLDSARRVFRAGQRIAYRCSIYNASTGNATPVEMEVQPTLYQGARTVWTGDPMPLKAEAGTGNAINMLGRLEVAASAGLGEFVLQVTVTQKPAPGGKPRTASEWTNFTLY